LRNARKSSSVAVYYLFGALLRTRKRHRFDNGEHPPRRKRMLIHRAPRRAAIRRDEKNDGIKTFALFQRYARLRNFRILPSALLAYLPPHPGCRQLSAMIRYFRTFSLHVASGRRLEDISIADMDVQLYFYENSSSYVRVIRTLCCFADEQISRIVEACAFRRNRSANYSASVERAGSRLG